jgi:hypothetical protein
MTSVVKEAYLLIHFLAMDVLFLRMLAPSGFCLPSRCLAMGLYVTIQTTPKQSSLVSDMVLLSTNTSRLSRCSNIEQGDVSGNAFESYSVRTSVKTRRLS